MSEPVVAVRVRGGWSRRVALAILIALLGTVFVGQAARADESKVPEDVAAYFATGLIPRLADLYGSPGNPDPASTFDDTTKVGTIHRLLAWTPAFLAGQKTQSPTELTNTWIAPVTAKEGTILGLAAVWINPSSDIVELADFSRGRALVDALGRAPKDTRLIDDTVQQAWFATDGKTLTTLVIGKSHAPGTLTPAEYQKILLANAAPSKAPEEATNPGLLIAGITLGAVVLLLAVFILLPGRKRKDETRDAAAPPRRNPRGESDRAFDREASSAEARAKSRARAAVNAEAGLVDAIAESEARAAAEPSGPKRVFEPDDGPDDRPAPKPVARGSASKPAASTKKTAGGASQETKTPAKKPTVNKPPAKKTPANKPTAKKPAANKPIAKKTPIKGSAAKEPPTEPA